MKPRRRTSLPASFFSPAGGASRLLFLSPLSPLRAALREDPDILLVGELRDLETAAIAIETAETGHLVFGTLHTTTAASTVDRLIDQFPSEALAVRGYEDHASLLEPGLHRSIERPDESPHIVIHCTR